VRGLARESSALSEAARLAGREAATRLRGRGAPEPGSGAGDPVVLVPGFLAGDGSLAFLSRHLRGLGYRTYRSRMHANVGCTRQAAESLERRVEAVAERSGGRVSVVGHSLGGLIARRLAARRPDLVQGIVTLGSPLLAPGAAHPLLQLDLKLLGMLERAGLSALLGDLMGADCTSGECARLSWEQMRLPLAPEVSFASVFSRRDGIVDWRSCLDPAATTVEVSSSHLGMAFDPRVLDVVAAQLSRQARPRRAPGASAGRRRGASR
jgi:pimeloyl-ACP methyl ester carboxylesterase